MSLFLNLIKNFNPDEDKFNNFINDSFFAKSYLKLSNLIKYIFKKSECIYTRLLKLDNTKYKSSFSAIADKFIKNIDDIYFIFLGILILSIPFAQTGILGILASVLIAISIINSFTTHNQFKFSTIHVPIFVYLLILVISAGFSSLLIPSLKGLAKMLIYIGSFFSFFEFLKTNPKKIIPTVGLIAFTCSLELLFSLKQMILGVDELASWQDKTFLNPEDAMNRIFGTLKPFNPNLFAAYLLATTPCIFAATAFAFFKKYNKKIILTLGLFSILGLITIIQTGCRGAYIGLFFGIIFMLAIIFSIFKEQLLRIKNFKKIALSTIGILAILAILVAICSPAIFHRLTSIFTFRGDSSNSYRMNVYISSAKMFLDNFWIGIGTGNTTYRLIYGLYMVTGFDALGAYNIYLEMAVESGIFALLTFLWMMILTFGKSVKNIFKLSLEYKIVTIACLSGIVAMLMHGFFDTVWYRPQLQLFFWLYMAILSVISMKGFSNEQ